MQCNIFTNGRQFTTTAYCLFGCLSVCLSVCPSARLPRHIIQAIACSKVSLTHCQASRVALVLPHFLPNFFPVSPIASPVYKCYTFACSPPGTLAVALCFYFSRCRALAPSLASHMGNPVGQLLVTGALTLDAKCLAACVGGWPALVLCHLNFMFPFSICATSNAYRYVVGIIGFWMVDRGATTFNNHIACHLKVGSYILHTFFLHFC